MNKEVRKKASRFQKKYREKLASNWKETITNSRGSFYTCYKYGTVFQNWRIGLEACGKSSEFIREMQTDSIVSIIFANQCMYRSAMMSLRSLLECCFNEIFFRCHPIEYKWWIEGDYKAGFFKIIDFVFKLDNPKNYEKKTKIKQKINTSYKTLSKYVHARGYIHMYSPLNLNPFKYEKGDFKKWANIYRTITKIACTMLLLFYSDEFYNFGYPQKNYIKSIYAKKEQNVISRTVGINDFFVAKKI